MPAKLTQKVIYFILIAIFTGAAIVSTVKGYHHFSSSLPDVDFATHYNTARLLLLGEDPYHIQLTSSYSEVLEKIRAENPGIHLSAVYFPSSLLLLLPFAALPLKIASQLWFLFNISLVILVLYLGFRYLDSLGLNPKVYYILCCIFISSSPFRTVINHGHLSLAAVSLVCLGYLMEKRWGEIAGGVFFALGLLKYALTAPFVIFQPLATRKWLSLVTCLTIHLIVHCAISIHVKTNPFKLIAETLALNKQLILETNWDIPFGFLNQFARLNKELGNLEIPYLVGLALYFISIAIGLYCLYKISKKGVSLGWLSGCAAISLFAVYHRNYDGVVLIFPLLMIFISRSLYTWRGILLMIILYYFFGQLLIWKQGYLNLMHYLPALDFTALLVFYLASFYLAIRQEEIRSIYSKPK